MWRILENSSVEVSGHDHDHDHDEVTHEKDNLVLIKSVILVFLLLAGLFVFFPYTQVQPKKEG
jgi:hypothetical protein